MELKVFTLRLVFALVAGILIGVERQMRQRSAGLATNALVSVGACTFILISETVIANVARAGGDAGSDSLRVLAQVVTGVGFLGAGAIIKDGFSIHGLNSAATIWCSAAVGCLCGFGYWQMALVTIAVILFINWVLKNIEIEIEHKARKKQDEEAMKKTLEQPPDVEGSSTNRPHPVGEQEPHSASSTSSAPSTFADRDTFRK